MSRQCAVMRCSEPATGFSTYCDGHKRAHRRHGHAEQRGVTVYELKPFRDKVAARRAKNPANPAWDLLEQRWALVATHAAGILRTASDGQAGLRIERQAAGLITSLAANVASEAVIDAALAMFVLQETQPHRFKSDRAFAFQLARRVRGLAEVHAGTYWDDQKGKVKRVYRDTPPRVLENLASTLTAAFGIAGLQLARLDQREGPPGEAERRQLAAALKEMK